MQVYLDNNATTMVDPKVKEAMLPFLEEAYANPSSPYMSGRSASRAITEAREACAEVVQAKPPTIFFTSGGTESNNTALQAGTRLHRDRNEIVISSVEHSSILNHALYLEQEGWTVHRVPVDRNGRLDEGFFDSVLSEQTALVSIMKANNESGVITDLAPFVDGAHRVGALFHTDAIQAYGKIGLDVGGPEIDFLSFSGHKIHGPKGCGGLYVREGIKLPPMLMGGDQEHGRRAGTENVPGIAGLGRASELSQNFDYNVLMNLKKPLEADLLQTTEQVEVAGSGAERLPGTSLFVVDGVDAESLVDLLDMEGIFCSSGSACMSGSTEPSHVLEAMGYSCSQASSGIRLSMSKFNSQKDVQYVIKNFPLLIDRLRSYES
ncbi:MAG: cysteine desulfurase family protein [Verrucomicrobiota bacterium]